MESLDSQVDRIMQFQKRRTNDNRLDVMSNPKYRSEEAYKKYKRPVTNYGSGRKCEYGDKTKVCDPSCRFWDSCIKGRQRGES